MTKVWVIEYGAYSDRYIDTIFSSREAAIEYLLLKHGLSSEAELVKKEADAGNWGEFPLPRQYDLWDAAPHALGRRLAGRTEDAPK